MTIQYNTVQRNGRDLVYRLEASERLDEIWDDLSDNAKYEIAENDLWFNDYFFEKSPEEINEFFEREWSDDDD